MSDLYGTDGPSMALGNGFPNPDFKDGSPIGLAELHGASFHCTDCKYIANGICKHPDPRIHNREVTSAMCCNLFDHLDMKVIV